MNSNTKTLGVDGNWILHRAFHTQKFESVNPGTIICRNFVSMVCKDALLAKATRILVGFDGARIFRYKLYPKYKANRDGDSKSTPYDYLDGLMDYLAVCGIPFVQDHEYEADDVLCSLVHQTEGPVFISTRDKDAYQYVSPRVTLIDSSAKPSPVVTRYKDIESRFGVPPELCLDLQTLTGDSIDNVPRLLNKAAAIAGLTKYGSLKAWLAKDAELKKQLAGKGDMLRLNRKLVKLVDSVKISDTKITWNSSQDMTRAYVMLKDFANPRSKGLF